MFSLNKVFIRVTQIILSLGNSDETISLMHLPFFVKVPDEVLI